MEAEERTTGKRSPQWAFMRRLKIKGPNGLYLDRLRIIATPWWGVYLHHIVAPDPQVHPHDHPWPFGTFVLWGGYVEDFRPIPHVDINIAQQQVWKRFSWHRMDRAAAHRITHILGNTWTLVFVGRRRGTWGFWYQGTWLGWDEYEQVA